MSVTRQQRRQQLLNELESVRHLLQEPSDEASVSVAADSIPVLSEIMPNSTINMSAEEHSTESATSNSSESQTAPAVTTHEAIHEAIHQTQTQLSATQADAGALQAPDAMQQLIAKLTQRQPANSTVTPLSETSENASPAIAPLNTSAIGEDTAPVRDSNTVSPTTMLFNPVSNASSLALNHAPPSLPLLFQAVNETPVFAAPTFTELELRQPQFSHHSTVDADTGEIDKGNDIAISDEPTQLLSSEDIDQLLFDIMPAVEELLRERLSAILLKR